jgi:hypothetical protein
MKHIFFTFLILSAPLVLRAQQTVEPNINNVVGIDGRLNSVFLTSSIGEPAIVTLETTQGFITQGFLQPELLPCVDIELKYYPNPAKDIITIEAYGCDVGIQSIQVVDIWGRVITTVTRPKDNQLDLGDFAQGIYLLKVKLTNDDIHAIPVVKTSIEP